MPPDCRRPLWLIDEIFFGESESLWQYTLTVETETWFVQGGWPQDFLPRTQETITMSDNNEVLHSEVSLQR
ncbi:MAG: Gp37 family protein [Arsenophonus sp. NC-QC1-MAG3]